MVKARAQWAVKKFWGTLALALIFAAVVVQVGRHMAPLVAENRIAIAEYFSRQLNATVTFGQLDAKWDGLRPELTIGEFRLHDKAGTEVLYVQHAVAQIDLLMSVWHRRARMWRVEMNGVSGKLAQTEQGWSLAGIGSETSVEAADSGTASSADPLEIFLLGRDIQLSDITLQFDFLSGRQQKILLTGMSLQNDSEFHRVAVSLDTPQRSDLLKFVFEGVGDPRDVEAFSGRGYLKLDGFPLANTLAFVSEPLAERSELKSGELSTELWLNLLPDAELSLAGQMSLNAELQVDEGASQAESLQLPQALNSQLYGEWSREAGWRLSLTDLLASWSNSNGDIYRQTQGLDLVVASKRTEDSWTIQIPNLDIEHWVEQVQATPQAPEVARRILGELGLKGHLKNLRAEIPKQQPKNFQLGATLVDVSVNDWKGSPQVTSLNGHVQASALSGVVEIDSPDHFFMHFPTVYHEGFEFDRAQGQVRWQVDPENNQVYVNSGQLTMEGDLGLVNGYFYLDVPLQRDSRPSELVLQIGLQDAVALSHQKLVPYVTPDSLEEWLDAAIVDGKVPSGGFLMQGYFGKGASQSRSVQLGLNVEQAQLKYEQRWPAIEDFDGYVEIDTNVVDGWVDRGRFLKTALQPTKIRVTPHDSGQGSMLNVNGAVVGEASSGLEVLTQTPLRDTLGEGFDDWKLSGQLTASVDLDIPLQAGLSGHRQQVDVTLSDARLVMQDLNLAFDQLRGDLQFNDRSGLSSQNLSAQLWQQQFALSIGSVVGDASTKGFSTEVSFKGLLDFESLMQWTQRPEVGFVEGLSPVNGSVTVGGNSVEIDGRPANVVVKAESSLLGSVVKLPAPFGKDSDQKRSLNVQVAVAGDEVRYDFDYQDLATAVLQQQKNSLRGEIALQEKAQLRNEAGIWLDGRVSYVDGQEWWPVIQRYQQVDQGLSKSDESESVAETNAAAFNLDLQIDKFQWDDLTLENVELGGGQQKRGWRIAVDDDVVSGELTLIDDQPLGLEVQYLRWPALAQSEPVETVDDAQLSGAEASASAVEHRDDDLSQQLEAILQSVSAESLLAMDIKIDELKVGDSDFGRWQLLVRPEGQRIQLSQINGEIRGVKISGSGKDAELGAQLFWDQTEGSEHSSFYGVLSARDLEDVSKAWGLPTMLDSKRARMTLDLNWPGSPAAFALQKGHGNLSLDIRDGRFYRSTGQATNALLRLVGLFNFDSWVRRLQLDFSDVYKGGTPYERIDGAIRIDGGVLYLVDPIEVKNTSSRLQMGGKVSMVDETLDTSLVATLPVGGNATLITALAAGLPAAAGVYAVSKIFKKQVDRVASVSYSIEGSWADPKVSFDKLFDSKAAKDAGKDAAREEQRKSNGHSAESNPTPESSD